MNRLLSDQLSGYYRSRVVRFLFLILSLGFVKITSQFNNDFTSGPIICPFRLVTGLPCPGCGTTRSVAALLDGRLADSLSFNPLGIVFPSAVLLWALRVNVLEQKFNNLKIGFEKLTQNQRFYVGLGLLVLVLAVNFFRVQQSSLI